MSKVPVVLVVDDEQDLVSLLSIRLKKENYKVFGVYNGTDALKMLESKQIDLVILDLMLPDMSGIEVCRQMHLNPLLMNIPVLILSALDQEDMVVKGLDEGANDYVTKPFSDIELMARVRALLRHSNVEVGDVLDIEGLLIDREKHQVVYQSKSIKLTPTEFKLLFLLASDPTRVFNREQILLKVMGNDVSVTARIVDVHIRSLRKKIGEDSPFIQTIRGIGYRFLD